MVMSHLDRTIFDDSKLLELARRGCYLEYDFFGLECSNHEVSIGLIPRHARKGPGLVLKPAGNQSHAKGGLISN